MKRFISFIILLTLLALPSCEEKCQHMYSKWSMDAEEHWISCDLCGKVEIESQPHDWVVISAENVDGVGVVSSMCRMCGQTATENKEIDRLVTNEEWDSALEKSKFDNVTVGFTQNDGGKLYEAIYRISDGKVREEILKNGVPSLFKITDTESSEGRNYVINTLAPFVDTFGGFEFDGDNGVYFYQRTEDDGSLTSFTFSFEFKRLTYFKATSNDGAYTVELSFSNYGKTLAE